MSRDDIAPEAKSPNPRSPALQYDASVPPQCVGRRETAYERRFTRYDQPDVG
jgi:hypothetical protein